MSFKSTYDRPLSEGPWNESVFNRLPQEGDNGPGFEAYARATAISEAYVPNARFREEIHVSSKGISDGAIGNFRLL